MLSDIATNTAYRKLPFPFIRAFRDIFISIQMTCKARFVANRSFQRLLKTTHQVQCCIVRRYNHVHASMQRTIWRGMIKSVCPSIALTTPAYNHCACMVLSCWLCCEMWRHIASTAPQQLEISDARQLCDNTTWAEGMIARVNCWCLCYYVIMKNLITLWRQMASSADATHCSGATRRCHVNWVIDSQALH